MRRALGIGPRTGPQETKSMDNTAPSVGMIRSALDGRSVVLVGLMGAGKTTIGRRLAARLELPFVDADSEIEKAAGKTIPDIFADHGEKYFRDGERRVIARLLKQDTQILATGGGAFMDDSTRDKVRDHGVSVWLRADLPLLMKRVMRRSHRPLLKTKDPEAVMQKLMDERYPVYAMADIAVDTSDAPHEMIVNEVAAQLSNLAENEEPA